MATPDDGHLSITQRFNIGSGFGDPEKERLTDPRYCTGQPTSTAQITFVDVGLTRLFYSVVPTASISSTTRITGKDSDNTVMVDGSPERVVTKAGSTTTRVENGNCNYGVPVVDPSDPILQKHSCHYETAAFEIEDQYYAELNEMADFLIEHPEAVLKIDGHTDTVGDVKDNEILATNRARTVKEYLIAQGVPEKQLKQNAVITVHGKSNPVDNPGQDQYASRINRRVEMLISLQDTPPEYSIVHVYVIKPGSMDDRTYHDGLLTQGIVHKPGIANFVVSSAFQPEDGLNFTAGSKTLKNIYNQSFEILNETGIQKAGFMFRPEKNELVMWADGKQICTVKLDTPDKIDPTLLNLSIVDAQTGERRPCQLPQQKITETADPDQPRTTTFYTPVVMLDLTTPQDPASQATWKGQPTAPRN